MKTWKDVIYYNNIIIRPASIFANFIVHLNTKYGTQLNANFYITKYENTNFEINEPTKFHRTTKIGIHKNKNIHSIIQISHSNSMTNKKDILLHLYISTVLITVLSTVIYNIVEQVLLTHYRVTGFTHGFNWGSCCSILRSSLNSFVVNCFVLVVVLLVIALHILLWMTAFGYPFVILKLFIL